MKTKEIWGSPGKRRCVTQSASVWRLCVYKVADSFHPRPPQCVNSWPWTWRSQEELLCFAPTPEPNLERRRGHTRKQKCRNEDIHFTNTLSMSLCMYFTSYHIVTLCLLSLLWSIFPSVSTAWLILGLKKSILSVSFLANFSLILGLLVYFEKDA